MPPDTDREPDEVVYLVGGAVRDELLGVAHKERDWVVVGSTPEALLEKGYKQVGASFPVFLHPGTGEEYALARTMVSPSTFIPVSHWKRIWPAGT